jgi:hypothetical protein
MFWDSEVSFGCLTTWLMWALAFGLIAFSLSGHDAAIGQLGLGLSAAAAAMTIIRDNQRTRRMVRTMRGLDDDVRKLR